MKSSIVIERDVISQPSNLIFRGKKRKGLSQRYLIEDDADKRWILMPTGVPSRPVPENEIQEVVVEIGEENAKPSGTTRLSYDNWCLTLFLPQPSYFFDKLDIY